MVYLPKLFCIADDRSKVLFQTFATLMLFTMILLLLSPLCQAQNQWADDKEWEDLLKQHKSRLINDTLYLLKAQTLTEKSFKDPALKKKLAAYRNIAWSDPDYRPFRIKYFAFLANHATATHQEGFAIYYLQKMEEELMTVKPYIPSLNQPRLMLSLYGNDRANEDKRIAIIDSVTPFLKTLPDKLAKQSVSINTCINAFTILKQSSQLYLARKDTVKVLETVKLAYGIWNQLKKKDSLDIGKMQQCRMSLYLIECTGARILSQKEKEKQLLNSAYQIVTSRQVHVSPVFKGPFERTILGKLIDFHIHYDEIDSTNFYYNQYKNKVLSYKKNEGGDGTKFLLYSGKVHAQNKDYRAAYQDIILAYNANDSIITIRMEDIQNSMYSHLLAEQSNEALHVAEKKMETGTLAIFIIVIALILTVCLSILRLRENKQKAAKQLEELNRITQIQIAELEANANLAQKKMGMELHDDIAGRLVNICNYIENQTITESNSEQKKQLQLIGEMAKDAYNSTRLKSHEWYYKGLEEEATVFSHRVHKIVDQALPNEKYEKQIEIDDRSLEQVSPKIRIHLLRIIQEAIANILKHAKASQIQLFLYEEDELITLQISDNGDGFKTDKKGIGLESLSSRVNEMNGSLDIKTSGGGTELLIAIPIAMP
jgi:signal transduction histidine kinase